MMEWVSEWGAVSCTVMRAYVMLHNSVQCCVLPCDTVSYDTVSHRAMEYRDVISCNVIWYHAMCYSVMWCLCVMWCSVMPHFVLLCNVKGICVILYQSSCCSGIVYGRIGSCIIFPWFMSKQATLSWLCCAVLHPEVLCSSISMHLFRVWQQLELLGRRLY
jgi:hypothetical protein